ncbi:hypothetical protein N7488_010136 [Penicillium malachiteum]|nr:hypothetical protein N7488_010136 [Penicillium malachiteum]
MAQLALGRAFKWQSTSRRSVAAFSQIRNYASQSAIPTFTPTASDELNQALARWRQDLFIPFGLPKRQRTSMFKEKHARRLEDEPITVNISENEQYTLRPLKFSELPKSKEIIDVLRLMEAANDYKNLVPFMSGLWNSQMTVSPARWQYLVRKTGSIGRIALIVECARQGSRTGLSLENQDITERLFFEFHRMAHQADFKGPRVAKALALAKQTADIMDSYPSDVSSNPKYQPYVIGTLLELSAARALDAFGGKDEANEVLNYVRKLMASWPLGQFDAPEPREFDAARVDSKLLRSVAVYKGLKLSTKIQGFSNDKALQAAVAPRITELQQFIAKQLKFIPKGSSDSVPSAELAKVVIGQK